MSEPRTNLRWAVEEWRGGIDVGDAMGFAFEGLEGDELDVIGLLVERVREKGVPVYGHLRLEGDGRDFIGEARDEVLDGLWYAGCALLKRGMDPHPGPLPRAGEGEDGRDE